MRKTLLVAIVVVGFGIPVAAEAGLWQNLFQGLDYVATPTGFPLTTTGDGTRVNGARSGRVRIVPNGVLGTGQGYRLEFDRTFGSDTRGRPETFRFGGAGELTLNGGIQMTAGYMRPAKRLYFGEFDLSATNLSYDLKTNVGAQDVELFGTLNAFGSLNANVFGFYELSLNVRNQNSTLVADGLLADAERNTNFDVGPISIKGNIFVDMIAGALGAIGADATDLETLFPRSPIDALVNAFQNNLQNMQAAQSKGVNKELAPLLLATVIGRDEAAGQKLIERLLDESITLSSTSTEAEAAQQATLSIPEAGTLSLLAVGGAILAATRRRR